MTIYEKLAIIQQELKAPKNQYNSFGKYKYRSCEDILESVKPLCACHKTVLILTDCIECIGGRNYIKATATLHDLESETSVCTNSYAREDETKKGMDSAQISGCASSYARKYALNGLFNIDDSKVESTPDPDAQAPKMYACSVCGEKHIASEMGKAYGKLMCFNCYAKAKQKSKQEATANG